MTELTPLPNPIRVLVVDDHPMVAQGIQSILESYDDLMVVGTLGNGRDVINQLDTLKPHVILMDLNMPEMGGLTATELVLERSPDTAVLILSMHDSPEYIASALDHGARGYVLKDGSIEPKSGDIRSQLTDREQTILLQLAQGLSNKDVARDLDISVRTVETHRKNIKRKLGISSTAGLTRYAMEHGVLQGTGR